MRNLPSVSFGEFKRPACAVATYQSTDSRLSRQDANLVVDVMTSGRQGVTTTHEKSTGGRLAVESWPCRNFVDLLAVDKVMEVSGILV